MIDFHYWPTPNGWKVAIMLEELGLPYRTVITNISKGDQFAPEFLRISPNNRMPAIVDHDTGGPPVPVFESGAILLYLAEKTGRLMPADAPGRKEALEWLFWQTGNQGPMAGQLSHFVNYAPAGEDYSRIRYANEYDRCLGVLDRRLAGREYILGEGLLDRRHHLLALGADRQAARRGSGAFPQPRALAQPGQGAPGGPARRRPRQGAPALRRPRRGGTRGPVQPDRRDGRPANRRAIGRKRPRPVPCIESRSIREADSPGRTERRDGGAG